MFDLNEVDQKSIYADDNGVWNTASPRSYYRVDIRDGRIENVVPGNKSSYTHYLRRQYGTHQATYNERGVSFQRIISTATSKYNIKSRYAVVQYIHRDSEEGDIVMKAHGNAKDSQSRPFFKTDLSVLDNIKEETRETKPRRLFKKLVDDAGGPLYSSSASSEPRNLQQIYNIRSSTKAATKTDQLTHLVAQIRESTFVHELAADGESLQYVLASEKQLMDLETFCTHQLHFSVFSVDSTFNIGNYYVAIRSTKLRVVHASGKYKGRHPLEMGPTFVHTHRDENSYLRFFSALNRMNPNFRYQMQAIGSDGDEATMNAIAVSFTPESFVNLLCASHKKENIEYKLKEMKSATPATRHIVSDIFGTNVDSILYQKGLIDSETTSEFDSRLRDLKTTWDHLVPTFHACNNRVESTNNNVKDWVGRSGKVTLPVFNRKVEEYATCQQQEFEMAIYANGPYDLASTHTYLRKERHIWNGLNAEERKQVIKQFWKSNVQGRKLLDKFLLINEH
ncbi:MAD2 [Mytilus edulis]|uniref:MAD2 n=1 Tax=Mytilus edulis TaxID=6550 RepID=A0A8S3Q4K1_MYTED|nr:MAD2 [Mytilus edulis]